MLTVGQTLYANPINNEARYRSEIKPVTVSKIGNKYFEVQELRRSRFYIDTMIEVPEYSSNYKLYFSRQDIEDEKYIEESRRKLLDYFTCSVELSVEKMKQLRQIIGI